MNARLTTTVASLAVSALLLAGCTNGTTPETPSPEPTAVTTTSAAPSPTPTNKTPTPEPSPSPTEVDSFPDDTSGDTPEQAEIRAGWENYYRTVDKFLRDPELNDLTETQHVTTGQAATDVIRGISTMRGNNLKRTGDIIYRDAVISAAETNADGVTIAVVDYCMDPRNMLLVDIDTGEPGSPDVALQPEQTLKAKVTMEKMPDGSWRAALSETEPAPC